MSLTNEQMKFLEEKGYLLIKSILTSDEILKIKARLDQLRSHEGPRVGEYGYSYLREKLIENNSKIRLWLFDCTYLLLKNLLKLISVFIPSIMNYSFNSKSGHISHFSLGNEIKQMLITAKEQFDAKDERVCDLVNKGPEFAKFYRDPLLLSAVEFVIGKQFKLSSLNVRSPKQHISPQNLHVDYPHAVAKEDYFACNSLWLLDDMNIENGATRLVPGSHKWAKVPKDEMSNPKEPHPDEIKITAEAGDMLFLNSHTWHGGTENISGQPRAIIQSYFVHKSHPPQQNQRGQIRRNTLQMLTEKDKQVLDIL